MRRTTLTIDEDVSQELQRLQTKQKKSFKQVVNEVLRLGLLHMSGPRRRTRTFHTKTVDLGRCFYGNVDDVAEVLSVAEGENFR